MKASLLNRKLHRWGAILTCVPVLIIVVTGIILQLKKESTWIQPSTARSSAPALTMTFDQIIERVRTDPASREAGITSWDDVDRLDVRVDRGVVKVRGKNRWEVQVDTGTGEILHVAFRRSDLIESIHDGSFFAEPVKLWVFLPTAFILLGLWVTGMYLWLLPHLSRRKRARAARVPKAPGTNASGDPGS